MRRPKSKAEIRRELQREVDRFLADGGAIEGVAMGVSGRGDGPLPKHSFTEGAPRQERTPVNEVVDAIEARRRKPAKPQPRSERGPQRKLITDDFGEPVRWVWVDE